MKKISIFSLVLAFVVLLSGCTKEASVKSLKELEISQTYIPIAPAGSTVTVTIVANTDWAFSTEIPEWITVSATSGAANSTTKVNFSAPACEYGREAVLQIKAGVHTQFVTVRQGDMVAEEVTCKEAMTGTAGKTYKVKGAVTKIVNTTYGNLYISDGSIKDEDHIDENACYIYGTLDEKGAEKNFLSLGIEVGDVITVEGPLSYFGGTTPELVNVTVSKIEKSLLKLINDPATAEVEKAGGLVPIKVAYKGKGAYANILNGADTWISLRSTDYIAGVPSKLVKEPADTMVFNFAVSANTTDTRVGTIQISSSNSSGTSNANFTITQASGLSCYSIPYEEKFDTGIGAWTISDVKGLASGAVWFHDSQYKQMKATGYVDGVNNETESDLISPRIDLTSTTVASLTFDHAAKFGASLDDEFTLWVSKDSGESWSQVLIPVYTDKKTWNFVTNTVSLNPFVGNQILVKFKYKSYTTGGSTLEIKNVKIVGENVAVTNIAQLQGLAVNKDTQSDYTANLTDAVVTYVNGKNAFIEDATGGVLLYKSGHGLKEGDCINGKVSGKITIYGGFAEATEMNTSEATVTSATTVTPKEITIGQLLKEFNRHISCNIVIKGVTFDKAIDNGNNRNANISNGEETIPVYAKVNTLSIPAGVAGDLRCYPCLNGTTKQVGVWDNGHFTK